MTGTLRRRVGCLIFGLAENPLFLRGGITEVLILYSGSHCVCHGVTGWAQLRRTAVRLTNLLQLRIDDDWMQLCGSRLCGATHGSSLASDQIQKS